LPLEEEAEEVVEAVVVILMGLLFFHDAVLARGQGHPLDP
jgi:hypothetical protein